ncbi:MAG: class I SAM-dependent methyltransferase [Chloroflexota bacterium]
MDAANKAIVLGHPSYIWGFGQERRLNLVLRHVDLSNRRILDIGCGVGAYVEAFRRFSPFVWGVDVDEEKVVEASANLPNLSVAPAESLPYCANYFDVTFLHEVIEHVTDDRQAIAEACRVTAPGGCIVIFAPNRLYPLETHGVYLGKRHIYKLVPFVNYLPDSLRRHFCPHVRCYTASALRGLFEGQNVAFDVETQVYPAFDNIARGNAVVAAGLRRALYAMEETSLRAFGLSHFVVARKLR